MILEVNYRYPYVFLIQIFLINKMVLLNKRAVIKKKKWGLHIMTVIIKLIKSMFIELYNNNKKTD